MKIWKFTPLILGLAMLFGCVANIHYDYDARANYASYKTFDWMAAPKYAQEKTAQPQNELMDKRVKFAIERNLLDKGFKQETVADPDFLITYYPVYQDRTVQTSTYMGWGWGYRPWAMGTAVNEVHHYQEGTIVIEIVDYKTKQLVWHGAAEGALTGLSNPDDAEEVVNREVKRLLRNFPPREGR